MIYTYQHNGQTYQVTLEQQPDGSYAAAVGERQYTVRADRVADGWILESGGRRARVYSAALNDERYIHVDGQAYSLSVPDTRGPRRRQGAAGGDALTAQMPGQVIEVRTAQGDVVEKGQTLIVMEAMKMEIRVSAPAGGRVARLLVEVGDVVERGQLLVEMEASSQA